jgi:ornithine carbamoyltransferase
MGQEEEAAKRRLDFEGFMVDEELMAAAADDAVFLHCLPAHRGEEVSAEVADGPQSRIFDQAENRLHAQKAVMLWTMGGYEI